MDIGKITEIKKTDNGLECRIDMGAGMVETAYLYGDGGQFEYPMIDDEVAVQSAGDDGGAENIIVAVFRDTPDGVAEGERITYSRDSGGAVISSVLQKSDGTVVINGGTRSCVGYSDLETAFNTLKTDFNNFINIYNAATLPVAGAVAGPPAVPGVASAANISPAESDTVKIP